MEISKTQTNERLNVQFLREVLCHGLEFRFPNSDNSDDEYGDF